MVDFDDFFGSDWFSAQMKPRPMVIDFNRIDLAALARGEDGRTGNDMHLSSANDSYCIK